MLLYSFVSMCVCGGEGICVCACVCVHMYVHACMCVCMYVCEHAHVNSEARVGHWVSDLFPCDKVSTQTWS